MEIRDVPAYKFTAFGYDMTVRQSGDGWIGNIAQVDGKNQAEIGPGKLEEMQQQLYLQARGNNEDVPQKWQPFRMIHDSAA